MMARRLPATGGEAAEKPVLVIDVAPEVVALSDGSTSPIAKDCLTGTAPICIPCLSTYSTAATSSNGVTASAISAIDAAILVHIMEESSVSGCRILGRISMTSRTKRLERPKIIPISPEDMPNLR